MSRLLIIVLTLCLATFVFANDEAPYRDMPVKTNGHVLQNPGTPGLRQGGDDIASATVITTMPFSDAGTTNGYIDDYDEACPYTGSTSPDVVYSYSPAGYEEVTVDLCYSSYDTKVYVYADGWTPGTPVACNDDYWFDDPCYTYSSLVEVVMEPGHTYYIVVDGYGGDYGDYVIDFTSVPYEPCIEITCHPDAQPEGEPPLVADYEDNYNGGCNASPEIFQAANWIDLDSGCMHMAGVSGWYPYLGSDYRDTDWFEIIADGDQVTVKIETDNDMTLTRCMMTTANPACTGYDYSFQTSEIEGCEEWEWTVATTAGAHYWVFVAPAEWISGPLEFNYCLEICGITYDVVPTEAASWGTVKSMYR